LTTAKALIFRSYWGDSMLVSINFSTGRAKYKTIFPFMANSYSIQLAIFKSDTVFYVSSNGKYFYHDYTYYSNWDYLSS
jgi:hypothetical protein